MAKWSKKRDIMQRYDSTSHLYDMRYAQEQTSKMETAVKNNPVRNDDLVLDIGCGTGLLFQYVADGVKRVVALDVSRETLLRAKERSKRFENVHLILSDADHLPVKSKSFDHLYFMTVLQNIPDPRETLEEARRVMKNGGSMVVSGLKKKFTPESFKEMVSNTGLNFTILEDANLNCRIAVCSL